MQFPADSFPPTIPKANPQNLLKVKSPYPDHKEFPIIQRAFYGIGRSSESTPNDDWRAPTGNGQPRGRAVVGLGGALPLAQLASRWCDSSRNYGNPPKNRFYPMRTLPPKSPAMVQGVAGVPKVRIVRVRSRAYVADRTDSIMGSDIDRGGGSRIANQDEGIGNQGLRASNVSTPTPGHEGGNECDLREREDEEPSETAASTCDGDPHDVVQPGTSRGRFGLRVHLRMVCIDHL